MRLQDKVAMITGGGRGIGRAIAHAFAQEGGTVVVTARTEKEITEVAREIRTMGAHSLAIRADVSDPDQITAAVDKTLEIFDRVDILVNNAAIVFHKSVLDTTLEEWDRLVAINLRAVFFACQAVLPQMKGQKEGKIINISSGSGVIASQNSAAYCVSKAGVIMLTECLALEMKPFNIDVNAIGVGKTHTRMADELACARGEADYQPELLMQPEDIAPVAVFLASDESRSITGANVVARKNVCPGYYGEGNLPPHAY